MLKKKTPDLLRFMLEDPFRDTHCKRVLGLVLGLITRKLLLAHTLRSRVTSSGFVFVRPSVRPRSTSLSPAGSSPGKRRTRTSTSQRRVRRSRIACQCRPLARAPRVRTRTSQALARSRTQQSTPCGVRARDTLGLTAYIRWKDTVNATRMIALSCWRWRRLGRRRAWVPWLSCYVVHLR